MKFSTTTAVALFGLTTQAFTVPILSERQSSPVTVLQADIAALQTAVTGDLGDITTAVHNSAGDAGAQVQLAAQVNADLQDITNQILGATQKAIAATTGAATSLNPVDVQSLVAVLQSVQSLVANVQNSLQNAKDQLQSETQAAIAAEVKAVQNALAALQSPLTAYAGQVKATITSTGGTDPGIGGLLQAIAAAISSLLNNLGLGSLNVVGTVTSGIPASTFNLNLPRQASGLPISLPTGALSPDIITQIISQVEALLMSLLGGTGLPIRDLSDVAEK